VSSNDVAMRGRLESIHLAPEAGAPMRAVERARAIAGQGLEGDRYALGLGHWSPIRRAGYGLTLVEREVIAELNATYLFGLGPGATRRNLTTSGIRLDALIGRRFRVGDVVCQAVRRCEPCSYLEGLLGQEVLYPLVHKGGIRVEILESGAIAVGDLIEALPD
jgi:MOSC domain-containing protein YiiM